MRADVVRNPMNIKKSAKQVKISPAYPKHRRMMRFRAAETNAKTA